MRSTVVLTRCRRPVQRLISKTVRVCYRSRGKSVLETSGKTFEDEDKRFAQGNRLFTSSVTGKKVEARPAAATISPAIIYRNPSNLSPMRALQTMSKQSQASKKDVEKVCVDNIGRILTEYQHLIGHLPAPLRSHQTREDITNVILLTSWPSVLGLHLLGTLLASQTADIYCVHRGADRLNLQRERNGPRSSSTEFPIDRITFVTADLSRDGL
jgi:hypothetical protein